jgi:hypothetical protein
MSVFTFVNLNKSSQVKRLNVVMPWRCVKQIENFVLTLFLRNFIWTQFFSMYFNLISLIFVLVLVLVLVLVFH